MTFTKGQSGNPAGREHGSRNRVTMACEELMAGQAEKLTQRAIDAALATPFDACAASALKLCIDRIYPPRRDRPVTISGVPKIVDAQSAISALARLIEASTTGEASPSEAHALGGLVASFLSVAATNELVSRLAMLEARQNADHQAKELSNEDHLASGQL